MSAPLILPVLGLGLATAFWAATTLLLATETPILANFAPVEALRALGRLVVDPLMWDHIGVSLQRVAVGLAVALAIGVPLGILTGVSRAFAHTTTPLFQFLRMISPLSWMPIAVMVLGVGDAPVYFLLAFAAVWPILLNTAAGVAQLDRNWLMLARSLSATRSETIFRVVLPGIVAHILSGVRLAIGIIWIILVPAEMLGVSAGLGYFILDARDRLAYPDLMAAILIIGALGFALDYAARWLYQHWLHKR